MSEPADVPTSVLCVCSQNCVEFYPLFLVSLWTCGMFFSEVLAAATGLVYMAARQLYFNGYTQSTKKRLPALIVCPKNKACTDVRRALCSVSGVCSAGYLAFT